MTLDPVVSLSAAIAEAPGSYAFVLGSGVSSDAGVPTGQEVFWRAVAELYRTAHAAEEMPGEEELARWLAEISLRAKLTYSEVLEEVAPDAPTRRAYLAKHFAQVEPGPTHELLAQLAERGLVRVFVTTNFDRLLERALQARGIEPLVITSDADVAAAPNREHADCVVLKPHGDYLQENIRNTPAELAGLEPGMTTELQEVVDRYGLVVLGYSGSDEALSNALRRRTGRYGLYWVARAELAAPARGLVEAVGGRLIVRRNASEFLGELERAA
jgi:phosphoglycolate phosphatase-like HAD superfamily hydrolase